MAGSVMSVHHCSLRPSAERLSGLGGHRALQRAADSAWTSPEPCATGLRLLIPRTRGDAGAVLWVRASSPPVEGKAVAFNTTWLTHVAEDCVHMSVKPHKETLDGRAASGET